MEFVDSEPAGLMMGGTSEVKGDRDGQLRPGVRNRCAQRNQWAPGVVMENLTNGGEVLCRVGRFSSVMIRDPPE